MNGLVVIVVFVSLGGTVVLIIHWQVERAHTAMVRGIAAYLAAQKARSRTPGGSASPGQGVPQHPPGERVGGDVSHPVASPPAPSKTSAGAGSTLPPAVPALAGLDSLSPPSPVGTGSAPATAQPVPAGPTRHAALPRNRHA